MINLVETLGVWIGRGQNGQRRPDNRPKRFAPYPVWSKARVIGAIAWSCYLLPPLLFVLLGSLWPFWLLLPALLLAPPLPGVIDNGFTAFTVEVIGGLLGSRYCPACAQSIFDDAPASGYMPDRERGRWWPRRNCASCDHDLTKRLAE